MPAINFTDEELSILVDCLPAAYNLLDPDTQLLLRNVQSQGRRLEVWNNVMRVLADSANTTFKP